LKTPIPTNRQIQWLHAANTGYFRFKKEIFYPLKKRILEQHGKIVGTDMQIIATHCDHRHKSDGKCNDCSTTEVFARDRGLECFLPHGTFDFRTTALTRYQLGNTIFHTPSNKFVYHRKDVTAVLVGYKKLNSNGYWSALFLYATLDRDSLKRHIKAEFFQSAASTKYKVKMRWFSLKYRCTTVFRRLFPLKNEETDVPF
jgi:hypothetical protein